jgi:hypothetical protein
MHVTTTIIAIMSFSFDTTRINVLEMSAFNAIAIRIILVPSSCMFFRYDLRHSL